MGSLQAASVRGRPVQARRVVRRVRKSRRVVRPPPDLERRARPEGRPSPRLDPRRAMSVLVEALSVVIRRSTLDDYYPGGTDSYLQLANSEASSARLACVDEELTSVRFLRPADAQQWIDDLALHNIFHIHEGQ